MVPNTVIAAQIVRDTFTSAQLESYGNVVLNGYVSYVPNTIGKKAWQYKETLTPPVDLPNLTLIRPAMKGWTTNYSEYYTEIPPNAYGVNPGDPTCFTFSVHSYDATGNPRWAQPPSFSASSIGPGYLYPVADRLAPPPIGSL